MLPWFLYPGEKHRKIFRRVRGRSFSYKGEEDHSDRKGRERKLVKPVFRKRNFRKATKEVEDVEIDFPKTLSVVISLGKFL